MKKLAAILVLFIAITGCAHLTAKDCAKYALQASVGVAVMAATGVDVTDFDPWSTNAILADIAVDSAMDATGYAFDEIAEADSFTDRTLVANEVEYLSEDSITYIECPPYYAAGYIEYPPYY